MPVMTTRRFIRRSIRVSRSLVKGEGTPQYALTSGRIVLLLYYMIEERGFEMKKTDLTSLNVAELKALAKQQEIKLPAGASKSDIVAALGKGAGAKKAAAPAKAAAKVEKKEVKAGPAAKKAATPARVSKPVVAPEETRTAVREWKMPEADESRAAESKYYTGPQERRAPARYEELPQAYGEERIVLMARDPYWAFVYWETTPERIEREKAWFGWDSKLVVRLYDITGKPFDGMNANGYYDQEVFDRVGSWYFDLARPSHSFCADIGLLTPDGRFLTLARSGSVTLPREGVSDVLDEEWMLLDEEFWKLYGAPGGLSSPEVQEMWRRRFLREVTSPGLFAREKAKRK
jgi:hypothetical protein